MDEQAGLEREVYVDPALVDANTEWVDLPAWDDRGRPLSTLRSTGLLWLINRVVFHPRGFALALHVDDDGEITGWSLRGDGSEVWRFDGNEDVLMREAEATLNGLRV